MFFFVFFLFFFVFFCFFLFFFCCFFHGCPGNLHSPPTHTQHTYSHSGVAFLDITHSSGHLEISNWCWSCLFLYVSSYSVRLTIFNITSITGPSLFSLTQSEAVSHRSHSDTVLIHGSKIEVQSQSICISFLCINFFSLTN